MKVNFVSVSCLKAASYRLSQDLEDIFSGPNLFNVLIGSIEICALGFNLTVGNKYLSAFFPLDLF